MIPWYLQFSWRDLQSWVSLVAQMVKNLPATQETWVRSLGWEDPLEKIPLQDSCLENSMDRGAWWVIVLEVAESDITELYFFFFFLPHVILVLACGILVPWPGIRPMPHVLQVHSLNHWTTRQVPWFIIPLKFSRRVDFKWFYQTHKTVTMWGDRYVNCLHNWLWSSFHEAHVYQSIMLYTLNIYDFYLLILPQ